MTNNHRQISRIHTSFHITPNAIYDAVDEMKGKLETGTVIGCLIQIYLTILAILLK